nr:hypothetical protein [Tanacetum cinerariifolium]
APSVIPVFDVENRPVPPVIHFRSTYEHGDIYSTREILRDINEVYPLGPVPLNMGIAMSHIKKLNEQMRGIVETSTRSFLGPFPDDPYVQARNAAMADDDVEEDDVEDDDDMDDDAADPSDP